MFSMCDLQEEEVSKLLETFETQCELVKLWNRQASSNGPSSTTPQTEPRPPRTALQRALGHI